MYHIAVRGRKSHLWDAFGGVAEREQLITLLAASAYQLVGIDTCCVSLALSKWITVYISLDVREKKKKNTRTIFFFIIFYVQQHIFSRDVSINARIYRIYTATTTTRMQVSIFPGGFFFSPLSRFLIYTARGDPHFRAFANDAFSPVSKSVFFFYIILF